MTFLQHSNLQSIATFPKQLVFVARFWKVLPYPDMAYVWCFRLNGPGKNVLEVWW